MKTNPLAYQSWDDLVFENRNKEYGAYALRQTYSEKLFLGLIVALSLIGAIMFLPSATTKKAEEIFELPRIIQIGPPPVIERILPQHPPQRVERVVNEDLPPRVVREPVEEPPVVEPVQHVNPGTGDTGTGVTQNSTGAATGVIEPVVATPEPEFYLHPEVSPVYENGHAGLVKYLQRNLKYPAVPQRMGIEGTVFVSFIVNGDGSVSNVEVIRGIHPDCDREAMRVISKMKGWTGGKQGGRPVRVKMVLPIKFEIK